MFGPQDLHEFPPRYNIAPTQPILVVMNSPVRERPRRLALLARWGLIPAFAKDPRDVPLLFNARSETAAERNSFRGAMRHRRCLVPANGFYEWRREGLARSQPFLVERPDRGLFAFAGLMETFLAADGSEIDTAAILTTAANDTLRPIHERMPVVIEPGDFERWLDCHENGPAEIADLLAPAANGEFRAVEIGEAVNAVANMGPEVEEPAKPGPVGGQGSFSF